MNNDIELPKELCDYFQMIADEKEEKTVDYLAKMIAPHLVGDEWNMIRKTSLLSLASYGLQKSKKKRRIHQLLLGKPGTGKSVDGKTEVIIKVNDEIKIVKIKDTEKLTDFQALSVNPMTLDVEWKKIYGVSKHEEQRKVLKIITRRKQEVIATKDHSFLKYDFEINRLIPIKGDELKEGDLIPFISKLPVETNNTEGEERNSTVYIPVNYDLFKKHTKGMLSHNYYNVDFIRTVSKECKKGHLTKNMAKKFNEIAKSSILDKLIKSDIYWSPIEKIEEIDCEGYVYDFSVEDNENFVLANGIVCHNTELMLWWQDNLQGVMINSENTSKTGLVGDARGGDITPGLLAQYDGNFVLLDELDKMSNQDANGLLQAMEEGSYKIIKGKHRKKFQAEVRVIASANDVRKIQPPLFDRFDFIYECKTATRDDRAKNVPRITQSFFGDDDEKLANILNGYMIWLGDTTPSAFSDKKTIDIYIANYIRKVKEVDVVRASYRFLEMSIMRIAWAIAKLHKREVIIPKDVEDAIVFKHDTMRRVYGIQLKRDKP
jgi:hypothetical protein